MAYFLLKLHQKQGVFILINKVLNICIIRIAALLDTEGTFTQKHQIWLW